MPVYRFFYFFLLILISGCNWFVTKDGEPELPYDEPVILPTLPEHKINDIEKKLSHILTQQKFNGQAVVAYKDYPIFRSCDGFRDFTTKAKIDFQTAFQVASVSKPFTSMAILMLNQRGLLNLDDTVRKYIPEFPYGNITIKHLLQHTSGLQNYNYFADSAWDKDQLMTGEDVLDILVNKKINLYFRPGQRHNYCNTGYVILALVVERITKIPFHEFLYRNIFKPLRMSHTFARNKTVMDTIQNIAYGYKRRGGKYYKVDHDPMDDVLGDKSIYTTADDLLRWDRALKGNRLVNDTILQKAYIPAVTGKNRIQKYGLGWRLKQEDDKRVIFHNGLWNGFTASHTRYIDDSLTIILTNNTNAHVGELVRRIYDVVVEELPSAPSSKSRKKTSNK